MKAPRTPTQFRTPVRHYHRTLPSHSGDWETWVGEEAKQQKKAFVKKLSVSLAILAVLAVSIGAVFLLGGF
jgi:hypothetical protein